MPTDADIELQFYEKFFFGPEIEPYPVQETAISHIFAGGDVMVTVPTGTGKTLIGKAALFRALRQGRRAVYTSPLRALTEEKYREFCADFGESNVGFATGDYKVNPDAPVQVWVAEILWNHTFSRSARRSVDVVVMDEGHYFNDPERGYVWEQSIIGLSPETQLVILSATIGAPESTCQWIQRTRRKPVQLARSTERLVPLRHEFREQYLVEVVKELYAEGHVPAIVFSFGRALCFERAHLLRSCRKFASPEEQAEIAERADAVLLPTGLGPQLRKYLLHGIGVHHAGILPAYRRLVEALTADRLLKFVVTTETISAGINLPAKSVVFPSLAKFVRGEGRVLLPAEYQQMAGRAGRPQFDTEGLVLSLAPEEVVQAFRKEIKDLEKGGRRFDAEKVKKKYYQRALGEAKAKRRISWTPQIYEELRAGEVAPLRSQTRITPEQILAIGLPELEEGSTLDALIAGGADAVDDRLNILSVVQHLHLPDGDRRASLRQLSQTVANMQALGILDGTGRQVTGELVGQVRGIDGLFVFFVLTEAPMDEMLARALVEFLVDHDVIQRILDKKEREVVRAWVRERLRTLRSEGADVEWEEVEAEYYELHPKELSQVELLHQAFQSKVPHPELHGGKRAKAIWARMEDEALSFADLVKAEGLEREEGSLFTYLARIMRTARMLHEASTLAEFEAIELAIRARLAAVDERVTGSLSARSEDGARPPAAQADAATGAEAGKD